ncbi:MAG: protein kinase [Nitrospirae bacterium]|nr:protein kinase [Nitrospirota bacterium]
MLHLESGTSLCSRFTLIRLLGRGGMGEAWLAGDRQLDQEVVTKIVPTDASEATIELLRQECRNARRLSHPNIVRVFDFHQCDGVSFITMEYVDGRSIESLRGAAFETLVEALLPLAEALEHAHRAGVVHRDVKASNILLDRAGKPRLMDFGIAGVLHPDEGDLHLAGGGSRYSTSPQQLDGAPPQPADDIYGFGALAYHLVTGHPPFWPDVDEERIRAEEPEPIHPRKGVSPGVRDLIGSMLAKSPADRPADMTAVREALEEIGKELPITETEAPEIRTGAVRLTPPPKIEAGRPLAGQGPGDESRNRFGLWTTVAVFAVLGVIVLGVFLLLPEWVRQRSEPEGARVRTDSPVAEVSETARSRVAPVGELSAESETREELEVQTESSPREATPRFAEEQVVESAPAEQGRRDTAVVGIEPSAEAAPSSDAEFRQTMSEGLTALTAGDSAAAKRAFQGALALSPGSPEAVDGLARAEENLRLAAISAHRLRATELERKEDWSAALQEYNTVFGLDPTIRFAREGRARAEVRSQLAERLEYHLAHPERLSNDDVLESAEQLLSEARSTEPSGPVLRRQIDSLAERLAVATRPIRVELVSDNLTEVTVYRVGRLGRFTQQVLDLRPGTYTVVGSRAGYRDVRRRLTVSPNQSSRPLEVRCEEEI